MNIEKERFEAWLFNQPRQRTIDLADVDNCLICAFVKENTNHTWVKAGIEHFFTLASSGYSKECDTPEWLIQLIFSETGLVAKRTFGQMQDSYRQLFPETIEATDRPKVKAT